MGDTTRLNDIVRAYDPVMVGRISLEQFPQVNDFAAAGLFTTNQEYNDMLQGEGFTYVMRHWNIPTGNPVTVTDNPADKIQTKKVTSGATTAVVQYMADAFSAMDVVRDQLGVDVVAQIADFDAAIWSNHVSRRVALMVRSMLDAVEATRPGTMTLKLATEAGNSATDANRIDAEAVLDTLHLAGRGWRQFGVAMIPSEVMKRFQKLNLIDFTPDSEQNVRFANYMGIRLVEVDDEYLIRPGTTDGEVADVIFFRPGAVGIGQAKPKIPNEFWRDPHAGNGSALTDYITRHRLLVGVRGIDWNPAAPLNRYPTEADLIDPDNYTLNADWEGREASLGVVRLQVNL